MSNQHIPTLLPAGLMAERAGVSTRWLLREARAGRIPSLQTDGVIVFSPAAVERVLLERAAGKDAKQ